MTEKKINVPLSMCKNFLAQKGLHVRPEATKKFEKLLRNWAEKISIIATKNAQIDNRKTIAAEDFDAEDIKEELDSDED